MKVALQNAEATIFNLQDGDILLIRVDPGEFTEDLVGPFMEALEETMKAAGHDTARCLVVSADTFELSIVKA